MVAVVLNNNSKKNVRCSVYHHKRNKNFFIVLYKSFNMDGNDGKAN